MESGNLGDRIYSVPVSDDSGHSGGKYVAGYGDYCDSLSDRGTDKKSRKEIEFSNKWYQREQREWRTYSEKYLI